MNDNTDKPEIVDVQISTDGLESMISAMGDPTRDKAAATYYAPTMLGDNELENGYRFGWIIPKIVDVPATDALRKWRDWSGDAKQIAAIKKAEKQLHVKLKTIEAYIKARLWGGGAIFINTGQDPEKPLNLNLVKRGGIKSLTVFSRKELTAELLVMDPFDENYGKPEYYSVANTIEVARIHHSHLVRFNGNDLPDPWNTGGVVPCPCGFVREHQTSHQKHSRFRHPPDLLNEHRGFFVQNSRCGLQIAFFAGLAGHIEKASADRYLNMGH